MFFLNVSKKYTLKMTIKAPFQDVEELQIGQLWEYDPPWFQFVPKYLKDFDYRLPEDGRDTKTELLESVKTKAHSLIRRGFLPDGSKLFFSMLPVEQVF